MSIRAFDLNIEEVLENWEVEHAIREMIANALDEQILSATDAIAIQKDQGGDWHIRDFGRGIRIEHFTLNENAEKLQSAASVIGKFGVGLKDALATFHRKRVAVVIRSAFGTFSLRQEQKHGFANIVTLHVEYNDMPNFMRGTDVVLRGVADADIAKAKALFLKFTSEEVLETTPYGQILRRKTDASRVYIVGVLASEEPNFLFSYNITSLTDSMKKRLNRERLNVGRTSYSDRVKAILKAARSQPVEDALVDQVQRRRLGDQCDEMAWIEVSQVALNLMHQRQRVVYFTEQEVQGNPNYLDSARSDGYQVVVVTEQQKAKLTAQAQAGGLAVRTLEAYLKEYAATFQYRFVAHAQLTMEEREVFELTPRILALVGVQGRAVPDVRISETVRITDTAGGVWDATIPAIVVKRDKLGSAPAYAAVLLHEAAHATTGTTDATRAFENVLTNYLGQIAIAALRR